jgi:hypothetical protein
MVNLLNILRWVVIRQRTQRLDLRDPSLNDHHVLYSAKDDVAETMD